jgi:hypothetical protein|tara:strand:- start:381 stop:614 length:234 start_codon:yes stop_codon:yes gene_type:complete
MVANLIMNALLAEANAKETKALANLQNYMSNSAGIGEHPDVVGECMKLVKDIAEAKEIKETIKKLIEESNNNQNQQK